MMVTPCMPPGELCALRGGVFVNTDTPLQRIAGGRDPGARNQAIPVRALHAFIEAGMTAKGIGMNDKIEGIGDEAYLGVMASLLGFRKGDVTVQLDGRTLPGGKDSQIAVAKKIAAKL